MIIGVWPEYIEKWNLQPGQVYDAKTLGMWMYTEYTEVQSDFRFQVLRMAVQEEWVESLRENGLSEYEVRHQITLVKPGTAFYKISMD